MNTMAVRSPSTFRSSTRPLAYLVPTDSRHDKGALQQKALEARLQTIIPGRSSTISEILPIPSKRPKRVGFRLPGPSVPGGGRTEWDLGRQRKLNGTENRVLNGWRIKVAFRLGTYARVVGSGLTTYLIDLIWSPSGASNLRGLFVFSGLVLMRL